jgi:redox-sensitive bicupin YhaK (pirin superfamily)
MISLRPFSALGRFRNHWLNARYHFSFADYYDPARLGHGPLRVWNDDEIAPQSGFDPHPHREMEIITYVREGAVTHRDSLGHEGRIGAGEVQVMHAGTGIVHAEYNLESTPTRLFQIWVLPARRGVAPGWEMRRFPREEGALIPMASGDPARIAEGALPLHAEATLWAGTVPAGVSFTKSLPPRGGAYLVPARGRLEVGGVAVGPRDGVAIAGESEVSIRVEEGPAELVLVELFAL